MSNIGLERAVARWGVKVVRTRVGDRYVVEEMRSNGYSLGGEQSAATSSSWTTRPPGTGRWRRCSCWR